MKENCKCGSRRGDNAKFCSSCRQYINNQEKKYCEKCYIPADKNDLFCKECGSNLAIQKPIPDYKAKITEHPGYLKITWFHFTIVFLLTLPLFTLVASIDGYKMNYAVLRMAFSSGLGLAIIALIISIISYYKNKKILVPVATYIASSLVIAIIMILPKLL